MNDIKDIWYGSYVHKYINARDARLKIRDRIKQAQSKCKEAELSAKIMGKGLHKVFNADVNKLNK